MKHRLHIGFIDPRWYRDSMRFNQGIKCIVDDFRSTTVNGLLIQDVPYPPSTAIVVFVSNNITCISEKELLVEKEIKKFKRMQELEKQKQQSNQLREDAINFHQQFSIPFKYSTARIGHLNGLRENSAGNGLTRASVIHLLVQEDYSHGRFKRRINQMLCGSIGKDYSGCDSASITHKDGAGKPYIPKVTCKECLSVLNRFIKQNNGSN